MIFVHYTSGSEGEMGIEANAYNGGHWRLEGEDIVQCTRATMQPMGPMLLFGDSSWTDFDLTLEAMPFEGGNEGFKILFRVQNFENLCGVGFGSYRNSFHDIWRIQNRKWDRISASAPTTIPGKVVHGFWHHVHLRIRDDCYRCDFDGIPLFDVSDKAYSNGKIGLSQ